MQHNATDKYTHQGHITHSMGKTTHKEKITNKPQTTANRTQANHDHADQTPWTTTEHFQMRGQKPRPLKTRMLPRGRRAGWSMGRRTTRATSMTENQTKDRNEGRDAKPQAKHKQLPTRCITIETATKLDAQIGHQFARRPSNWKAYAPPKVPERKQE